MSAFYVVQDGDQFLVIAEAVKGKRRLPAVWARCHTEFAAAQLAHQQNGIAVATSPPAPESGAFEPKEGSA